MNLSSVIVHCAPDQMANVSEQLGTLSGVEVHAADDGKLIATLEAESEQGVADLYEVVRQVAGVLSVSMVYHQYEPDPDKEA